MEAATSQRTCPNCGTVNNEKSKFCIKCGTLLDNGSGRQPAQEARAPIAGPPQPFAPPARGKKTIEYNPQIIEQFAVRLYLTARIIVVVFTLIGLLGGGAGGYSLGYFGGDEIVWAIVGAVVLSAVGFWMGWEIAFRLKLRAQLALCQVQIEENGR